MTGHHPRGATLTAPGMVQQLGTGTGGVRREDQLAGPFEVAELTEKATFVPVAQPESALVSLLHKGSLVTINTGDFGCSKPTTPATYRDIAYVVCAGQNKVIRLTPDGKLAGDPVQTKGKGDAELIWDEDRLVMNAPGADEGVVVGRDGEPRPFDRSAPEEPGELGDRGVIGDGRQVASDDRPDGAAPAGDENAASLPNPAKNPKNDKPTRNSETELGGNELPDPTHRPKTPQRPEPNDPGSGPGELPRNDHRNHEPAPPALPEPPARPEQPKRPARPDEVGPPAQNQLPEPAGPREQAGPPEHAEHAGPPEHAERPEHTGPPEHAGRPEHAGPPEHSQGRGNQQRPPRENVEDEPTKTPSEEPRDEDDEHPQRSTEGHVETPQAQKPNKLDKPEESQRPEQDWDDDGRDEDNEDDQGEDEDDQGEDKDKNNDPKPLGKDQDDKVNSPEPTPTSSHSHTPSTSPTPQTAEPNNNTDRETPEPNAVPTAEPSPTADPSPTAEPSPTAKPSPTAEPSPTVEPSPTTKPSPTAKPSPTPEQQQGTDPGQGSSSQDSSPNQNSSSPNQNSSSRNQNSGPRQDNAENDAYDPENPFGSSDTGVDPNLGSSSSSSESNDESNSQPAPADPGWREHPFGGTEASNDPAPEEPAEEPEPTPTPTQESLETPAAPSNVQVPSYDIDYDSATVHWDEMDADEYEITLEGSGGGTYVVDGDSTSYKFTGLWDWTNYTGTIRAVNKGDGSQEPVKSEPVEFKFQTEDDDDDEEEEDSNDSGGSGRTVDDVINDAKDQLEDGANQVREDACNMTDFC